MDTDDSDFYGDDEVVAPLKSRVASFDAGEWWQDRGTTLFGAPRPSSANAEEPSQLHNSYAGVPYAWQLTETVDAFLARLPPSTTIASPELPWIYICNPYIPRKNKFEGQNQRSRGNEDEAPEEEGTRLDFFLEGGMERLHILTNFMEEVKKTRKTKAAIARETARERNEAARDIQQLAHNCHIRSGKWMIFCTVEDVDDVWEVVAKATAKNELGIAAKVAPHHEDVDPRKERIICVYTADFAITEDVERVLMKLRDLRLVDSRGKQIYYKPDAYTYLGISYGNAWDLRASIYSSSDFIFKKAT